MIDFYTVTILAADRNDDSVNIESLLFFIIIMAIGMIFNIAKAKTEAAKSKKEQEVKQARAKKRKELLSSTSGTISAHAQDGQLLDPSDRKRSQRHVSLPGHDYQAEPRQRSAYARGGFEEVLAGTPQKSSLERFIELKGVNVPRPAHKTPGDISSHQERQDDTSLFSTLKGIEGNIDLVEAEPSDVASADDSIFDLSLDTVAQAIIYREILDKPLALRPHS